MTCTEPNESDFTCSAVRRECTTASLGLISLLHLVACILTWSGTSRHLFLQYAFDVAPLMVTELPFSRADVVVYLIR